MIACIAYLLAPVVGADPKKVLFIGNSFTYGPPPYDRSDQLELNNLPRLFKFVSESKGKDVIVEEDTLGGCTLHVHRPSNNPPCDPANDSSCRVVNTPREPACDNCTIISNFTMEPLSDTYKPCPQLFERQPHGPWDIVVLQDHSALPTVAQARELMYYPAFEEYASKLKAMGGGIVASYMTWSYYMGGTAFDVDQESGVWHGGRSTCPGGFKEGCFPFGDLDTLTDCNRTDFHLKIDRQACQAYSLARAAAQTLRHGADVVVPAGFAWQAVRGSPDIPVECRALIDVEYPDEGPLASLQLPLAAKDPADALFTTQESALNLFRDKGPAYFSKFCNDGCHVDQHASINGMYLNALVFFATLFGEDPVGAAVPDGATAMDGQLLPAVDPVVAAALQRVARDVVMDHMDVWWGKADATVDLHGDAVQRHAHETVV